MSIVYTRALIYYFSGTGNARFAASTINKTFQKKAVMSTVVNLADPNTNPASQAQLIGFCFPTHGFNAPPIILRFLFRFPRGNANVFLLNTRAGLKLSRLYLPGIGGMALWIPAIMLWLKGYKVVGFRPLDMPSNWISLHPGLKKSVSTSIRQHCTETLERFSHRILRGRRVLNGLLWLPLDLLLAPISFAYYFLGRYALAKTFYANYNCNNCNFCIDECPVGAVVERSGRPYWKLSCESCMHCMNVCPHKAIETAHAYVIPLWWFVFSALPYMVIKAMLQLGWLAESFYNQYFDLIYYAIMLPVSFVLIFSSYRVFHWLLGYHRFNKFFSHISPTHYAWWRRYYLKSG